MRLSQRVINLNESATLALNARVKQLEQEGKQVFNLTAGELDASTPAFIQRSLATKLDQNKYTPTAGKASLRQAIASYESSRLGRKFGQGSVVVTAGVKTGLYALLQALLNNGDEVILPTPAWVSYVHMIALAGGQAVKVPLTENNDLDPVAIAKALTTKTKAIIINSPHNPTGSVFSKAALVKLAKSINGRPILVISDEIYATLVYGQEFYSIAQTKLPDSQLAVLNGFSKSQAITGWRIGYAVMPAPLSQAVVNFLSHVVGNAPLPAQLAAEAALAKNNPPSMLKTLERRRRVVEAGLNKIKQIKYTSPKGAFYFWLDIRNLPVPSAAWCEELLEQTGVALVPGEAFFAPGFVRLSFTADDKILKAALGRLKEFIESSANA